MTEFEVNRKLHFNIKKLHIQTILVVRRREKKRRIVQAAIIIIDIIQNDCTIQIIQDSISPVWEEPFRFLIHDPKYQELDIEVFDSVKEKSIGKLDISLERLLKDDDMVFEQPFPLRDSGHNSTLTLSLQLRVSSIINIA